MMERWNHHRQRLRAGGADGGSGGGPADGASEPFMESNYVGDLEGKCSQFDHNLPCACKPMRGTGEGRPSKMGQDR